MNIVLMRPDELDADQTLVLSGRRLTHIQKVLGKAPGDELRVGLRGGQLGMGRISTRSDAWVLECVFDTPPPPKLPMTLVLALPRPPVLRRVLQQGTTFGVARIVLLHAQRVEKSYWSSPALQPAAIDEQLDLGLEQAVDTIPPIVEHERRFRPFVEDRLAALASGGRMLLADPRSAAPCPVDVPGPVTLIVGPEGGWVPFELDQFATVGAEGVSLGARILRVETAVFALLGRLGLHDRGPL